MTYKELYLKEHPECKNFNEVIENNCPEDVLDVPNVTCNRQRCTDCWDREATSLCSHYDDKTKTCKDHMDHEHCVCGGDMLICDFFPSKRDKAKRMIDNINKPDIKDSGFKSKDLIPVGEEITKGIEEGILEPKTSVDFDGAEFQKKVYEAFGIPEFKPLTHEEIREYAEEMIKSAEEEISSIKDIEVKPEIDLDNGVKVQSTDHGMSIKDSGSRREFSTGAVRDIQEGKGRCDLMPLDVVADYICELDFETDGVLWNINEFQRAGTTSYLFGALSTFEDRYCDNCYTMILEVAKHFEAGAAKYGEWNWQKGIPTHCYIDSAVRHYLKFLRGDKDEPHDRAFVWNILCCIWTCKHKPELNDYPRKEKTDGSKE